LLIDIEVDGLEDARIGGDEITCPQRHHITGHDVFDIDFNDLPGSADVAARSHAGKQRTHRGRGAPLLPEAQCAAADQYDQDDQAIDTLTQSHRERGGHCQKDRDRAADLAQQEAKLRVAGRRVRQIRAAAKSSSGRLLMTQTCWAAAEPVQDIGWRFAPERLDRLLRCVYRHAVR
jgi:hypothetical protein